MSSSTVTLTLRQLLTEKAGITSVVQFGKKTGMSRQQSWALWHGKDTLGLRVAKRIAEATGLSIDELAEVQEAVPGRFRRKASDDLSA